MRNFLLFTAACICVCFLMSCRQKTEFHADVTFSGVGSQPVTIVYRGSRGISVSEGAIVDSKLTVDGNVAEPSMIEIYSSNKLLGRFVAAPNEKKISVKLKANSPLWLEASGNEISEKLAAFIKDTGDNIQIGSEKLNNAVAAYVEKNPSDPASAFLLAYYFDANDNPKLAATLYGKLKGDAATIPVSDVIRQFLEVRTDFPENAPMPSISLYDTNDSVINFIPEKGKKYLYCFEDKLSVDTNKLRNLIPEGVRLVDVRMRPDTNGWRRNIVPHLPKTTLALHAPLNILDPSLRKAGIYAIPFYIAVDTAGTQIYRGTEMKDAVERFRN